MSWQVRWATLVMGVVMLFVAGCGGGGGGGGGGSDAPVVVGSVTPGVLKVETTTTSLPPTTTLQLAATPFPTAGLYVSVAVKGDAVQSAVFDEAARNNQIQVTFQSPFFLKEGVYTDEIIVTLTYDPQGLKPISNSPIRIPVTYTVAVGHPEKAIPQLGGISPETLTVGSTITPMMLSGSNFAPTSQVFVNGTTRTVSYTNSHTLWVTLTADDLSRIASLPVFVSNTSTGGGESIVRYLKVVPPTPHLSELRPATVGAGGSDFMLRVIGTGFTETTQVYLNGSPRSTTYVSSTQMTAQITAADIAAVGTATINVLNPAGPVQSDNILSLPIANAPLAMTQVSPTQIPANSPATTVTVVGSGFQTGAVVTWNGAPRPTTYVSTSELLARLSPADLTTPQSAVVSVSQGGATTKGQAVTVATPSKDATGFQLNPQQNGYVAFDNIAPASSFPLSPRWAVKLDGVPAYALTGGGRVYTAVTRYYSGAPGQLGNQMLIYGLDAASGATLWGPVVLNARTTMTYDNGRLFLVVPNDTVEAVLVAMDAASGAALWSTKLTQQSFFWAPPTAANGHVYVAGTGSGGTLLAFDQADGLLRWSHHTGTGSDRMPPTASPDGVYQAFPCQIYAVRPLTGESIWTNQSSCSAGGTRPVAVANGQAVVANSIFGDPGGVYAAETGVLAASLDLSTAAAVGPEVSAYLSSGTLRGVASASQKVLWSFAGDGALGSAPIMVNGYTFILSDLGRLYALDAKTGSTLWDTQMPSPRDQTGTFNFLTAGNGLLFVPNGSFLYAYTLSTRP